MLTDRNPNAAALADVPAEVGRAGAVSYYPHPIDACAAPPELSGVRTLFAALHHFPPGAVVTLLTPLRDGLVSCLRSYSVDEIRAGASRAAGMI